MHSKQPLEILSPCCQQHSEDLSDLLAKVFSHGGYFKFRNDCRNGYLRHSHYDWQASRIGVRDGRIVSHYGVWDYQMRVGTSRVRVGGIGGVATHGDYLKQGLMAATTQAAVAAMRQLGYDMTILFGIDNFYHRFGYVRAWSDTNWFIRAADLPAEAPTGRIRKFAARPRADLAPLHNRHNAAVTGTAVRPTFLRLNFPGRTDQQGYLWTDARGRTTGYLLVARSGARLDCFDACGDTDQILRVLGMLARKWNCQEVFFETLPYASDLALRLRWMSCRSETRHHRCGGAMIHAVNLPSTLGKITGELSRRLRLSPLSDWRGNLTLSDARDTVTLSINRARVTVAAPIRSPHAIRGGNAIAQLIIGTDEPLEVAQSAAMRLTGDARQLIQVLFPNQHPQLHLSDRY